MLFSFLSLVKESITMGTPKKCTFLFIFHLVSLVVAQEMMEKRGPQGFLGMRGKKLSDSLETDQFYKRKPQFFVGVKGKKSMVDILESGVLPKRTPMGFFGVRGKKDPFSEVYKEEEDMPKQGSLVGAIDYTSSKENSLDPYPVLNELLNKFLNKIQVLARDRIDGEISDDFDDEKISYADIVKRAANIHQFFGVRGKKSIQDNKRPYDVTFRGKFIGVRGKKDIQNTNAHEIKFWYDRNDPLPKRKGQMGFIGMRGKKWMEESTSEESPN